jgi:hypothetical protein
MRIRMAVDAGSPGKASEDRAIVAPNLVVVLDGATVRTETGCIHGVAWYVERLASAIVDGAALGPTQALATAISRTADIHRDTCDLDHVATPSAAAAIVEIIDGQLRYLVLGDVTVVIDTGDEAVVVVDNRVSHTAVRERAVADGLRSGSAEKAAALVTMKHAELAARNTDGGYWIAASNPAAAAHALTGAIPVESVRRAAVLTDGATRAVDPFGLYGWPNLLDALDAYGPAALITQVRAVEASDPDGSRWPRNKLSDDATAVFCQGFPADRTRAAPAG